MNKAEAKALILEVLGGIAPEAELDRLPGAAQLRDELDLDTWTSSTLSPRCTSAPALTFRKRNTGGWRRWTTRWRISRADGVGRGTVTR